jgi:hypothetical protein
LTGGLLDGIQANEYDEHADEDGDHPPYVEVIDPSWQPVYVLDTQLEDHPYAYENE